MTIRARISQVLQQEDRNFLLTNPPLRRLLTRFMGSFSQIEQPLVRTASIAVWRFFCDVDLSEAKHASFCSLHDCFIRELKDGARPLEADPDILVSPCDAVIGASGAIVGTELFQIKGSAYSLADLLAQRELVSAHRNGRYVTLRLTAGMYHRFHAPHDCRVEQVTYISGDAWNVNPITLKRIEKIFCKNERALIVTRLAADGHRVTLVPVAAVLVASIRLNFLDVLLNLKHRGANVFTCDVALRKGEEMGWFQHGSTIILLAPERFALCENVQEGRRIRMGQPLMRLPAS